MVTNSSQPKYKQIISEIEQSIRSGELKQGDQLPSLNTLKARYNLSRDTVIMAFNDLKSRGVIYSVVGKGYYVKSENIELEYKIFILFDELNAFKEDLYNGLIEGLNDKAQVDIYFHHFNFEMFKSLIRDNVGTYNYYVIMPANLEDASKVIAQLPGDQVYILDQMPEDLQLYSGIYQNFRKNIIHGLEQLKDDFLKYEEIHLVYRSEKQPNALKDGFEEFCTQNHRPLKVVDRITTKLKKGVVYVCLEDKHLIQLIKEMKSQGLELVSDIGILCYNDTPLKEIVEGGITTISPNFAAMGKRLSAMILNHQRIKLESPFEVFNRNSL